MNEIFMRFSSWACLFLIFLPSLMFRYERSHFELNLLVADVNLRKLVMVKREEWQWRGCGRQQAKVEFKNFLCVLTTESHVLKK